MQMSRKKKDKTMQMSRRKRIRQCKCPEKKRIRQCKCPEKKGKKKKEKENEQDTHYDQVMLITWIPWILSFHPSLSSITLVRSS